MIRSLLLLVTLLSGIIFASLPAFCGDWSRYTFDDLAFRFKSPSDWNVGKMKATATDELVSIVLPKNTARSGFTANIVFVSSVNQDKTKGLAELYRLNMEAIASSPDFPGFKQENSYNIKLGNLDAYQTTFTYKHPKLGLKLKSFQIYAMKGDRLYVIQYAAPTLTYKKYMNDVNEIVRTFEAM